MARISEDLESKRPFVNLPPEILSAICDALFELRDIEISVANKSPPAIPHLRYRFSDPFKELRPFLNTCKLTREVVEAWIGRNVQFYADSAYFEQISAALGSRNCLLVKNLRLELNENSAALAEKAWPKLLDAIVTYLPDLRKLVIWTCSENGRSINHPYVLRPPPYGTTARSAGLRHTPSRDHRRVAVWKFAAFLALRHANLQRMTVWKYSASKGGVIADSIVSRVMLDDGTLRDVSMKDKSEKHGKDNESSKISPGCETLDSVLIRCTKWDVIVDLPVSHFYLQDHTHESSQPFQTSLPHEIYNTYVEQQSFTTKAHQTEHSYLARTNDELINLCDTYTSRLNLSGEEHLQHLLEDADSSTKVKLDLERQLREAREELGTKANDYSSLQRRLDWAINERNHAVDALRNHTSQVMEDRIERQISSGFGRFGLDDWYRGTRARGW